MIVVRDDRIARVEAQDLDSLAAWGLGLRTIEGCVGIGASIGTGTLICGTRGLVGGGVVLLTPSWRADWAMVGAEIQVQIEGLAKQVNGKFRSKAKQETHLCLIVMVLVFILFFRVQIH